MLAAEQISRLYPHQRNDNPVDSKLFAAIDDACEWYRRSLYKQLVIREKDNDIRLRPSMLGKPAIDIVSRKFFPELYRDNITEDRFWQLLHDGDTFECDYRVHLELLGIPVLDTQVQCDWHGVIGSADIVVELDGKRVLLELKTGNDGYYKSILKMQSADGRVFRYGQEWIKHHYLLSEYSNYRGHLTQGAIYGDALECDEVVIVLKDKDTSEVLLYNMTRKEKEEHLARAARVVEAWDYCDSFPETFLYTGIPAPRKEIQNRVHTGRYLVNPSLYGSPIIPLIYEWSLDGDKVIIDGYRVHEEAETLLPNILKDQYNTIELYTYGTEQIPELLSDWQRYQSFRREK